jgi:hypothetical protein
MTKVTSEDAGEKAVVPDVEAVGRAIRELVG